MKCENVKYKIVNDVIIRADKGNKFISTFNTKTGFYVRSGIIENGKETNKDPFMASFPHLIDVGIMGHCIHGKKGLCIKAGIQCYQSGSSKWQQNMSLQDFERIASESQGLVDQFALGGRGDPDCHEHFEEILKICKKHNIIPNYTTSGFLMNEEKAKISKQYCGAVAVSWYRSEYTLKAIKTLIDCGVKTNIHYVIDNNTIDEAIEMLKSNSFPKGINAIVFLLFKPVGQGTEKNMISKNDPRLNNFFIEVEKPHLFKIGFDSCFVPGVINNLKNVKLSALDTCEGARFSMYISSDLIALPCSFDQNMKYAFNIKEKSIYDAWISDEFESFRKELQRKCPTCPKKEICLGGCPLIPKVVLCKDIKEDQ